MCVCYPVNLINFLTEVIIYGVLFGLLEVSCSHSWELTPLALLKFSS